MINVQEALMSEEEKRSRKLESQRRLLCPEGEFIYIHKECIDETMILLEKNDLIVFPDQIEEFSIGKVMVQNDLTSIGECACCKTNMDNPEQYLYRLWVLTKDAYAKNVEYRGAYKGKKEALNKKRERHEKWQNLENKTPLMLLPITRLFRKWAYRLFK